VARFCATVLCPVECVPPTIKGLPAEQSITRATAARCFARQGGFADAITGRGQGRGDELASKQRIGIFRNYAHRPLRRLRASDLLLYDEVMPDLPRVCRDDCVMSRRVVCSSSQKGKYARRGLAERYCRWNLALLYCSPSFTSASSPYFFCHRLARSGLARSCVPTL
jgi:hypothetical protein